MIRHALESVLAAALVAAVAVPAAADVEVTTCSASVPMGTTGYLSADLDCSGAPGVGVSLGKGSAFDLRGHSLIGNPSATNADGVACEGSCTILGPGTIRDFSGRGVAGPAQVTVTGATIQNVAGNGIDSGSATATGVIITGVSTAIRAYMEDDYFGSTVRVTDSTLDNNAAGVSAYGARVINSSISGNDGSGVSTIRATIIDSVIEENSFGVSAELASVQGSTVSFNANAGIRAFGVHPLVKMTDSTVSDNGSVGIEAWDSWFPEFKIVGRTILSNSEVSRNGDSGVISGTVSVRSGGDISDNGGSGISARKVVVKDATINGNGEWGIFAGGDQGTNNYYSGKSHSSNATIIGNGRGGVYAANVGVARVDNSPVASGCTITGNNTGPNCGVSYVCADLYSLQKPRLNDTTCETSYNASDDTDWDVCSLDPS